MENIEMRIRGREAAVFPSALLQHARDFVECARAEVNPKWKPVFHLSADCGWINDPNGFIRFDGKYHLFWQHHPYSSEWGPMHWGHAVSEDLTHWTQLPEALAPDMPYDSGGCFSGTAFVHEGRLCLMYTGCSTARDADGTETPLQQQCIAWSEDGVHFTKHPANPVIRTEQIPRGSNRFHFRDPKAFCLQGVPHALVASNAGGSNGDAHGQVLLYRCVDEACGAAGDSLQDLANWSFVRRFAGAGTIAGSASVAGTSGGSVQFQFAGADLGIDNGSNILAENEIRLDAEPSCCTWECPDFFPLDGKHVLVVSPQGVLPQGYEYRNRHSCIAIIGQFDESDASFAIESFHPLDSGFDFYAAQTAESEDGRRIMVAWMAMWETEYPNQSEGHGWAGAMTLPRELFLRNGRVCSRPARETLAARSDRREALLASNARTVCSDPLPATCELEVGFRFSEGSAAQACGGQAGSGHACGGQAGNGQAVVELAFEGGRIVIECDAETGLISLDRSEAGRGPGGIRQTALPTGFAHLTLDLIVDRSSIEVFVNGGERVLTACFFPSGSPLLFSASTHGEGRISSFSTWTRH